MISRRDGEILSHCRKLKKFDFYLRQKHTMVMRTIISRGAQCSRWEPIGSGTFPVVVYQGMCVGPKIWHEEEYVAAKRGEMGEKSQARNTLVKRLVSRAGKLLWLSMLWLWRSKDP